MKTSAGILLYREKDGALEVCIVHPSGGYNAKAPWSIPKGEPNAGESNEDAARRETREEVGVDVQGSLIDLGHIDYTKSRKRVFCFAAPLPDGANPRCASWEIDRAEMMQLERAKTLIHHEQAPFLARLAGTFDRGSVSRP